LNQHVPEGVADGREPPVKGVDRIDGGVVVHLAGELEALLACCAEAPRRLVVDLGDVSFVDSTALGVFIEARSRLDDRQAFVLAAPGAETKRALEISGLDRHFKVHPTVDEALAS
jgi:anti-anti-sigma factor